MSATELDLLLSAFAEAHDATESEAAARALVKNKSYISASRDPRLFGGLERMVGFYDGKYSPEQRLTLLSWAFRVCAAFRLLLPRLQDITREALRAPPPPLSILKDGEERGYAALAVACADADWVAEYSALAIAQEESAEKARLPMMAALLARVPVSAAINLVAGQLEQVTVSTEKPAESMAKRLKRILEAFRPTLISADVEIGERPGEALRKLFTLPFYKTGKPEFGKYIEDLASEACGLVHDLLRTQLSIVDDASVYSSLTPIRDLLTQQYWPVFYKRDRNTQRVVHTLLDAILLLARQNVTDQDHLAALQILTGSREAAGQLTQQLAIHNPALPAEARDWLHRFGKAQTSYKLSGAEAAREASSDSAIASLLLSCDAAVQGRLAITPTAVDELQLFNSELAIGIRRLSSTTDRLINDAKRLAGARRLSLQDTVGNVVDYVQHAHDLIGGHKLGVRKVRIVNPMVVRQHVNGTTEIVIKALVQAIEENA